MQLALTTQTSRDFVFYTSKGLVIDRFFYDKEHWGKLEKSILAVYFCYIQMKLLQHKVTYILTHEQVLQM